jgi:hypothetical protein
MFKIKPLNDFSQIGLEKELFLIDVLIDKFFDPTEIEILQSKLEIFYMFPVMKLSRT